LSEHTLKLPAAANLAVSADLAQRLGQELDELLRRADGHSVHLDASALEVYDTSTLALVLQLRRRVLAAGRHLLLQGAPDKLLQLAALYGVAELVSPAGTEASVQAN
jgi:phospholipid transport system transporter-binding protein